MLCNRHAVKPNKSYIVLNGTQYPVCACSAIDEPTTSRNFKLRAPYDCNGKLVYMTPNQWFQVDQVLVDGEPQPGLEVAQKELGEVQKIKLRK